MQPRTTIILLAIAAALGAFVWFYEIRGGEAREEAEARAKQLFPDVAGESVEAIWFRTADDRDVRLERQEGEWRIVEPISFPGDGTGIDGLARNLADLASEGVIEEPQSPEVYGLGDESRVIQFRAAGADHTLRIGKKTPVGGNTYAATAQGEGSPVYTVPSFRVGGFQKTLADLREHRLLRFDPRSIVRVEARWPDGRVLLQRAGEEEDWRLLEPIAGASDQPTVDGLLSDLRFLRAERFLDEPDPDARAALEQAAFAVSLETAAEEGAQPTSFELVVGGLYEGGRIARSSQEDILYTIPKDRLDDFPRKVVAYRFRELANFTILDAHRLEMSFLVEAQDRAEEVVIVAERDEEGWHSEPERTQAGKAARLVSELSRLKAEDIVADSMGDDELAALGLSPPRAILRVFRAPEEGQEQGARLTEVHLGRADPERGILARVADRETVYSLDYELAEHLPVSLEAFRNRFVSEEEPGAADAEPGPEAAELDEED